MQRILSLGGIVGLVVAVVPASAAEVQPSSHLRVDARTLAIVQQAAQPQFAAHLTHWDLSPQLPEALFVFTPPAGAHRIRFLAMPSRVRDQPEEKQ